MTAAGFGRMTDPPASLLLVGARVVDPANGTDAVRDLGIVDGRLVPPSEVPPAVPRIEAHRLVAAPGFCDLHVHLREPGDPATETIESGARAAAKGGFTTICAMPNTDPPIDTADAVETLLASAEAAACRVRPIGAVTRGRDGGELADLRAMTDAGAIGFSDDGLAVGDEQLTRSALECLRALGRPLFEHAEDPALAAGGVMRAGPVAARLGLAGWPAAAELAIVERDLRLARTTGARVHLTHLSSAASIERVREAKVKGLDVTCDVTPHHLALAETWIGGDRSLAWEPPGPIDSARAYDGSCRVNPPLATREDAAALLTGVEDGTVDAIATDHAPHPPEGKVVPFAEAAPGLIGLETALSLGLAAVGTAGLSLMTLIAALSTRPAAIVGERRDLTDGAMANLVVFDPTARWRVERGTLASASWNTPLLGRELPGVVRLTVAEGRVTYQV